MNRRLPPDAFAYYLGLGVSRSYQAVADHFEVSKQAVVNLAGKEDWPSKLREAEKRVGDAAARRAEESIEAMNERHLKSLKVIQAKALEGLRSLALGTAMDAVRALDLAIRQERVIRGEPGDRSAIDVGDLIRREHERWLTTAGDDAASGEVECEGGAAGKSHEAAREAEREAATEADPSAPEGGGPPAELPPASEDATDEDEDGAGNG